MALKVTLDPPRPIQIKRHKKIEIGFEMERMSFLTRSLSTMKKAEKLNFAGKQQ